MESTAAKPVFIVGSPRSGTSILTWCPDQHPNILPLDESTGLGNLTIALSILINSSNVPVDFKLGEPDSDSEIIDRVLQLNAEIETSPQPGESSASAADKLETELNDRGQLPPVLDKAYATAHADFVKAYARAKRLAKELENKRAVIRALKARH